MAHSGRNQLRSRAPKRTTLWNPGPFSTGPQSVTANGISSVNTGQTALGGVTLVRIRGVVTVWLEVVGTIGDGFGRVTAGIGIVTTDAFTAGAASMPSPQEDADWGGWLWFQNIGALIGQSVTEAENTGVLSMVRIPIDSKAMRKIAPNETIFGSLEFQVEVGSAMAVFAMDTRMLVKLS